MARSSFGDQSARDIGYRTADGVDTVDRSVAVLDIGSHQQDGDEVDWVNQMSVISSQ